jgi:hypothetical protein
MIRFGLVVSMLTATLVACSAAETGEEIESNEGSAETAESDTSFYVVTGPISKGRDQESRIGIQGVNVLETVCDEADTSKRAKVCEVTHVNVDAVKTTDPETFGRLKAREAVIRGRITEAEAGGLFLKAAEVYRLVSSDQGSGTYYMATGISSARCPDAACRKMKLSKLHAKKTEKDVEIDFPVLEPLFKETKDQLDPALEAVRTGGVIIRGTLASGRFTPTAVFNAK